MGDKKIQWHPAFVAAMNLEFRENRSDLTFFNEYNLNTRPLEIDLLVIKKNSQAHINSTIGEIFRGHNIIEYKSPDDALDIDVMYKTIAYASLYKSYGTSVDERKAEDITVTIIRESKPKKLLRYFKEHGIPVENPHSGIYHIPDGVLFSTQIIVTMELERDAHKWIKSLSGNMNEQDMRQLFEASKNLSSRQDREFADSVLNVTITANPQVFDKIRRNGSMLSKEALDIVRPWCLDILEPELLEREREAKKEIEQARKEAKQARNETKQARNEANENGIRSMTSVCKEFGISFADTVRRVAADFELSEEEANKKVRKYWG